jgi:hypothetical protein
LGKVKAEVQIMMGQGGFELKTGIGLIDRFDVVRFQRGLTVA